MILIHCAACGREIEVADFLAGLNVVCKHCGQPNPVPVSHSKQGSADESIQAAPDVPASSASKPTRPVSHEQAIRIAPAALPPLPVSASLPHVPHPPLTLSASADPQSLPEWAIERARMSLRLDMSVTEIEQRLMGRGLTQETAAAVVEKVLGDQVRQQQEEGQLAMRRLRRHRVLSGVVAASCFVLAYGFNGISSVAWTASWLALPLACIWFGANVRVRTWFAEAEPVPEEMVRLGGWLALLALAFYRVISFVGME